MKHKPEYIKNFDKWQEDVLKSVTKRNWKANAHIRYLAVSNASKIKLLIQLRKASEFFGKYN